MASIDTFKTTVGRVLWTYLPSGDGSLVLCKDILIILTMMEASPTLRLRGIVWAEEAMTLHMAG